MATTTGPESGKRDTSGEAKPLVLITGAAGSIGRSLVAALQDRYLVVGLDRPGSDPGCPEVSFDLTSDESVQSAMHEVADRFGRDVGAVIHLAAYFDFTGEENPLYDAVNIEGTRRLVRGLQDFNVARFIYSGTMLVHRPGRPGEPINEDAPIEPRWAYPASKARAEEVIAEESGDMPYLLLHLAGLYDETVAVPTLAEQIRRVYERNPKSHAYSGALDTGQSLIHREDMVDAFVRAVDRRKDLPRDVTVLVGEPQAMGYRAMQERLGELIHGEPNWRTVPVPKAVGRAEAWLETKGEPVIPDALDKGEKPFIRPFMIAMADDHYELDISRARELLGWRPKHSIKDELETIVRRLKDDPLGWYRANHLTPPRWLTAAEDRGRDPEEVRATAERERREEHARFMWAPLANVAFGLWLVTSPAILGYQSVAMTWSDVVSGALITLLSLLTVSWKYWFARWAVAALGLWVMTAPLLFWAPTATAYLNGTLVGALVFGFAALARPAPGVGPDAAVMGPTVPKGWEYTPSSWFQRLPIIALALVGFFISRHLAAYQLGHIEAAWDPFFPGAADDPKNATEEIITSSVSEAWPVPDAGLGALTYMLEILTGVIGSARRWRTMPWLVILFGIMIVPLGVVSITFIVIQPIVLTGWCTLCLIAAAAMLIQIPYSIDELVATGQFLTRRVKAGRPLLRVLLVGDTDEGPDARIEDSFEQRPGAIIKEMLSGGISVPWTLAVSVLIGVWLMFTRLTLGAEGAMANADHLIGALVITVSVTAAAEAARTVRYLNGFLGMALVVAPFILGAPLVHAGADILAGLALIGLCVPRGRIKQSYGSWSRYII